MPIFEKGVGVGRFPFLFFSYSTGRRLSPIKARDLQESKQHA